MNSNLYTLTKLLLISFFVATCNNPKTTNSTQKQLTKEEKRDIIPEDKNKDIQNDSAFVSQYEDEIWAMSFLTDSIISINTLEKTMSGTRCCTIDFGPNNIRSRRYT